MPALGSCWSAGRYWPPRFLPALGQPVRPPGRGKQACPRGGLPQKPIQCWRSLAATHRAGVDLWRPAEVAAGGGGDGQAVLRGWPGGGCAWEPLGGRVVCWGGRGQRQSGLAAHLAARHEPAGGGREGGRPSGSHQPERSGLTGDRPVRCIGTNMSHRWQVS